MIQIIPKLFASGSTSESGNGRGQEPPGKFASRQRRYAKIWLLLLFIFSMPGLARAQNDLANPSPNIVTIPTGSFVIPMDSLNYYTSGANTVFNLNTYGLLFTLLNNKVGIHWFIKAGKSKDGIDFSANIKRILPTSASASTKNLYSGPMVIYPRDTVGVRTIIKVFNNIVAASLTGRTKTKVNVYQTTAPVSADLRYILTQKPTVAVLNDGGNANIQTQYFTDANIPASNHSVIGGTSLMSGCYTLASQPHNDAAAQANLDSIQSFLNQGGNFFAQCKGVFTYEDFTPSGGHPGFFQTTEGITLDNTNTTLSYPNGDVAFNQYIGSFNSVTVTGSEEVWYLTPAGSNPASVFKNHGYITVDNGTPASGSNRYDHISASVAKVKANTSAGSMMFYAGGHDFSSAKGSSTDFINGERLYFNAMLTPCGTRTFCNSLFFDIDMSVTQTVASCYSYGDTLTISVKTKANGPSSNTATGVVVIDTIPSGWTYVSSSATSGSYNSSTDQWTLGNMAYLDSETLTLKVVAKSYTNKTLSATVDGDAYDQNNTNDTSTVTTYAAPLASTGSSKTICIGSSTQIGASAVSGDTYSWTSSPVGFTSTSSNPTVSPTSTTTYTLTETNPTTGCSHSNHVTITVASLPAAAVISNATICSGSSISVGATTVASSTYSWISSPAGFTSTAANPSVSPASTTTYTLTETNSGGCVNSNSVTITVNPLPSASVASNTAFCSGNSTAIGATAIGGDSYSWSSLPSGFSSTSSNPTVSPTVTTAYTLIETITATGCNKSNSVTITVYALPAASIISNTVICSGNSISIGSSAVGGSSYSWISSPAGFTSTLANPSVSPTSATTYTLTETNSNGCINSNSVTITVNALPAALVISNTAICTGNSISIGGTAVGGSSYSWTSSPLGFTSTLSNPSVSPTSTTTYTLTETNSNSCVKSNSVTITVNALPTASVISNTAICTGNSVSIGGTAVGGSSYSWLSSPAGFSSTLSNPGVSPTSTTTYTLAETNSNGCVKSNSVTILVNSNPAADAGTNSSICSGTSASIGASSVAGDTYAWVSVPSGFSSTASGATVSPTVTTTYKLTETTPAGCSKTDSVIVTVNPLPNPSISGDNAICEDSIAEIYTTASVSGDTYSWLVTGSTIQSGQNTHSITVIWSNPGTGQVSVTETNSSTGCFKSQNYPVTIYTKPGPKSIFH